jgi:Sulfotransferase domain
MTPKSRTVDLNGASWHRARLRLRREASRLWRSERELPSYFVVGAKRAGTTSFDAYVGAHPNVESPLATKGTRYFDVNFDQGWSWFVRHFPLRTHIDKLARRTGVRPIIGDTSPYYCFHPEAMARIADRFPEARLIFLLRNPVERTWSHYNHEVRKGNENLTIHEALDAEDSRLHHPDLTFRAYAHRHYSYLSRSQYAAQIQSILDYFPRDQLLLLKSEDLFERPDEIMAKAFSFLGLRSWTDDELFRRVLKANPFTDIPADVRERLEEYFIAPNQALEDIVGSGLIWSGRNGPI